MRKLNRYDFANDKAFSTHLLSPADVEQLGLPECDVIGLRRNDGPRMDAMRPDEALILARLLIDAVWQVTEGYSIEEPKPQALNFSGIPIVSDVTVPKDQIHLRQDGRTETVLKMLENGECREVWRSPVKRGTDGRAHSNNQ